MTFCTTFVKRRALYRNLQKNLQIQRRDAMSTLCIEPRGNSFQLPVVICNSKLARDQVYHRHKDLCFHGVSWPILSEQLAECEAPTIRARCCDLCKLVDCAVSFVRRQIPALFLLRIFSSLLSLLLYMIFFARTQKC